MDNIIPREIIENKIYLIRGQKVMLDKDLADLYQVTTRNLKRQVRRNADRFPGDFMIELNDKEIKQVVCQNGSPSKSLFGGARPYAFTEHGILMLSSVLNSQRAVQVNIEIMRAFLRLRQAMFSHKALLNKIQALESKCDKKFKIVFEAIKMLITPPAKPTRKIGFLRENEE